MGCIIRILGSLLLGLLGAAFSAFAYLVVCALWAVATGDTAFTIEGLRITMAIVGGLSFVYGMIS